MNMGMVASRSCDMGIVRLDRKPNRPNEKSGSMPPKVSGLPVGWAVSGLSRSLVLDEDRLFATFAIGPDKTNGSLGLFVNPNSTWTV